MSKWAKIGGFGLLAVVFATPVIILGILSYKPSSKIEDQSRVNGHSETQAPVEEPQKPQISAAEIVQITNQKRVENGLAPLAEDPLLTQAACAKLDHMVANNYWAHVAPDGTEAWVFIQNLGYTYDEAGENLAEGFLDGQLVVEGWMRSPAHKENILKPAFNETGACSDNHYTVALYADVY